MAEHWAGLPYLDVLRPDPGWVVEQAILATYSADLVAVVAALLALAGLDDDRGSGSKVDFANAFEQLRGKVRILVQPGQISVPARRIPVMAILDGFLREVDQGQGGAWHPKIAMVKFTSAEAVGADHEADWRLWMGSRNLTRSLDWDVGLALSGYARDEGGQHIPGVGRLGAELVRLAKLGDCEAEQVRRELELVQWKSPNGIDVRDIRLLSPGNPRGLPQSPGDLKRLWVISPFLDGTIVKKLGRWGGTHTERRLLSTRAELGKLQAQAGHPLINYSELLTLSVPDPEEVDSWPQTDVDRTDMGSQDEQLAMRGLHAKLIYAEHNRGRTLWLGSANMTMAGWNGPNTEVVARLSIKDESIVEGLEDLFGSAELVDPSDLSGDIEQDEEERMLDEACRQVIERWRARQSRHADGPWLICKEPPHPDCAEIELRVGLLACDLLLWSRAEPQIQLLPVPLARETELIHIQLSLRALQRNWLQRAPLEPPPGDERDRHALARHLDPRTFLLWIRCLLGEQDIGDGGGDWDAQPNGHRHSGAITGPEWWAPTLEEMLKAWSRDPKRLRSIDQKVKRYLAYMAEQPAEEQRAEDNLVLHDFEKTWGILCQALLPEDA